MSLFPQIIVIGGSSAGLEKECSVTSECLYSMNDGFIMDTSVIPNLNTPCRSPCVYLLPEKENQTIVIAGGCIAKGRNSTLIRYVEISNQKVNSINKWFTCNLELNRGLSCAAYCQFKKGSCFICGGYDGLECVNEVFLLECNDYMGNLTKRQLLPLINRCKNSAALITQDDDFVKKVLIFGGWDGRRTLRSILEYSIYKHYEECSLISVMQIALEGHTITRIYKHNAFDAIICGGYNGVNVINGIYTYEIKTRKMKELLNISLKVPRENHIAFSLYENGRYYFVVAGGWDGKNALDHCEVFEILNEEPYLLRICDHNLKLNEPRNRPGAAYVK